VKTVSGREVTIPVAFRLRYSEYQKLVALARQRTEGNLSKTARDFVLQGMREQEQEQEVQRGEYATR